MLFQLRGIESERAHSRREMLRKVPGPMAGNNLLHHLLLHKTPRPIARDAFFIREEVVDDVVIQRGHVLLIVSPTSVVPSRCEVASQYPRRHDRATERAHCV